MAASRESERDFVSIDTDCKQEVFVSICGFQTHARSNDWGEFLSVMEETEPVAGPSSGLPSLASLQQFN